MSFILVQLEELKFIDQIKVCWSHLSVVFSLILSTIIFTICFGHLHLYSYPAIRCSKVCLYVILAKVFLDKQAKGIKLKGSLDELRFSRCAKVL